MNTITANAMVHTAMDGQSLYSSAVSMSNTPAAKQTVELMTPKGANVAQSIEHNLDELKADYQQLQKM